MPILHLDTMEMAMARMHEPTSPWEPIIMDVFRSIVAQELEYDMLPPNGPGDLTRWIFWVAPFTVMDPESIPPEPNLTTESTPEEVAAAYQPWYEELRTYWGSDQVDSILMYGTEFNVYGKPFTVWGYWTDEAGAGGLFGQSFGDPNVKVLFC